MNAPRASLLTVCSVALVAYASCDMIHEVMGHGAACAITPGVRAVSISTVALQTSGESRLVAAAGSVANVIAGVLCFALFRRRKGFDAARYGGDIRGFPRPWDSTVAPVRPASRVRTENRWLGWVGRRIVVRA